MKYFKESENVNFIANVFISNDSMFKSGSL